MCNMYVRSYTRDISLSVRLSSPSGHSICIVNRVDVSCPVTQGHVRYANSMRSLRGFPQSLQMDSYA